jgi:hypothetical protein
MPISILHYTQTTSFLEVKVALSIHVSHKPIWAFPAGGQCALLAWSFHLYHGLSSDETFKQVVASSAGVCSSLFLLGLLDIE